MILARLKDEQDFNFRKILVIRKIMLKSWFRQYYSSCTATILSTTNLLYPRQGNLPRYSL